MFCIDLIKALFLELFYHQPLRNSLHCCFYKSENPRSRVLSSGKALTKVNVWDGFLGLSGFIILLNHPFPMNNIVRGKEGFITLAGP